MQKQFQYRDKRVKTIDFKDIPCYASKTAYLDKVIAQLKADSLYSDEKLNERGVLVEGLLFRGFNAARIDVLLEIGTDTANNLCCVTGSQLERALREGDKKGNAFSYAEEYAAEQRDKPALVVFNGALMGYEGGFVYELPKDKPASAIVAVYILENLNKPKKAKRKGITPKEGRLRIQNRNMDDYCLREGRLPNDKRQYQKRPVQT